MKITIAAVGRLRPGPEQQLIESYVTKSPWTVDVREVDAKSKVEGAAKLKREADLLLEVIPRGAKIVCLDSRGKIQTSEDFANILGRWRDDGARDIAFVIGGSDGLDQALLKKADLSLSFGAVTWPHMLARVLVTEQLYRAHCILTGHPYHRGH